MASAAFQLSTAFEQQLPGPALPGLVTLGYFLPHNNEEADLQQEGLAAGSTDEEDRYNDKAQHFSLSLAVGSSGQRVFIHNNTRQQGRPTTAGAVRRERQARPPEQEASQAGMTEDEVRSGLGEAHAKDALDDNDDDEEDQHPREEEAEAVDDAQQAHADSPVRSGKKGGKPKRHHRSEEAPSLRSAAAAAAAGMQLGDTKVVTLSFGRETTAIAAGRGGFRASTHLHGTSSTPYPAAKIPDALLLGSSQSLLAYDIATNVEFFYKELAEGVRSLVHGKLPAIMPHASAAAMDSTPIKDVTVIGGNGAVQGYDAYGVECYWAVTGEQVSSMAVMPWRRTAPELPPQTDFSAAGRHRYAAAAAAAARRGAARMHLLAASQDHVLQAFDGADVVSSIVEADTINVLVPQYNPFHREADAEDNDTNRFAYLLNNGTVGVYAGAERLWRIKGQEQAVAAAFCDVDGDGEEELVVGWASGKVEVRGGGGGRHGGGEVLFRHVYPHPIAGVLSADYRGGNAAGSPFEPLPLIVTTEGRVHGLQLHELQHRTLEATRQLSALEEALRVKQELQTQLETLEHQLHVAASGEVDATLPSVETTINVATVPNPRTQKLDIQFFLTSSHPSVVISSVVLRCDPALRGSTTTSHSNNSTTSATGEDAWCFVAGDTPSSSLFCPVSYDKIQSTRLHASVCVGGVNAANAQVMELFVQLPAFIMYCHMDVAQRKYPNLIPSNEELEQEEEEEEEKKERKPSVSLFFNEDLNYKDFPPILRQLFSIPDTVRLESFARDESGNDMEAFYRIPIIHLVSMQRIVIDIRQPASASAWRTVVFSGAGMKMCGDILQALESALPNGFAEHNAAPVHVRYRFEKEGEALRRVLQMVQERNEARTTLSVGMADAIAALRVMLIQAEDARLLGEMASMKRSYASVMEYNYELLADNKKRLNNFDELKAALKAVNLAIQQAARLRLGAEARGAFVTLCRSALRENNIMDLLDLITTGVQ